MKIAEFDPKGGDIKVDIKSGFAKPGNYILVLWEKDDKTEVKKWEGKFSNPTDGSHFLPTPTKEHDGRLINCSATFTKVSSDKDYQLEVVVSQDGNVLAKDKKKPDKSEGLNPGAESFIRLKKK